VLSKPAGDLGEALLALLAGNATCLLFSGLQGCSPRQAWNLDDSQNVSDGVPSATQYRGPTIPFVST
jgi:hypothetical protein